MCAMFCKSCGRSLFDSGEERFCCPYCGAEIEFDFSELKDDLDALEDIDEDNK